MTLLKAKHNIKEIQGVRCSVVEAATTENRVNFLKDLLTHNGYEVKWEEDEKKPVKNQAGETVEPPTSYTIGVTDLVFNPVIMVYERGLKTKNGNKVTPDYWNQKAEITEPNYWDLSKKNF